MSIGEYPDSAAKHNVVELGQGTWVRKIFFRLYCKELVKYPIIPTHTTKHLFYFPLRYTFSFFLCPFSLFSLFHRMKAMQLLLRILTTIWLTIALPVRVCWLTCMRSHRLCSHRPRSVRLVSDLVVPHYQVHRLPLYLM